MGLRDFFRGLPRRWSDEDDLMVQNALRRKLALETIKDSERFRYLQAERKRRVGEVDRLLQEGVSALGKSKPADAVKNMRKILDMRIDDPPREALVMAYLGLAHYLSGDRKESLLHLKMAQDKDPDNFIAPILLSRVADTLEEAKEHIREACRRSPKLREQIAENFDRVFNTGKVSSSEWARSEYMRRYVKIFK